VGEQGSCCRRVLAKPIRAAQRHCSSLFHVLTINQRDRRLGRLDLLPKHAAPGADVFPRLIQGRAA
jgi:hypothetical protein